MTAALRERREAQAARALEARHRAQVALATTALEPGGRVLSDADEALLLDIVALAWARAERPREVLAALAELAP